MSKTLQQAAMERLKFLEGSAEMVSSDKRSVEGTKLGGYLDSKGFTTTGVGNLVSEHAPGSKEYHKDVKEWNKKWQSTTEGKLGEDYSFYNLTDKDAKRIFKKDFEDHKKRIANKINNFDKLPQDLQVELIQAEYRGDALLKSGKTPSWIKKFNKGTYKAAAKEFLNHREYKKSSTPQQIKTRLESVADAIDRYGAKTKMKKQTKKIDGYNLTVQEYNELKEQMQGKSYGEFLDRLNSYRIME